MIIKVMQSQKGVIPIIVIVIILILGGGIVAGTNLSRSKDSLQTNSPVPLVIAEIQSSPVPSTLTKASSAPVTAKSTPVSTPRSITLRGYAYEDRNNNSKFDADDIKLPIRDLHWYDSTKSSQKLLFQTDSSGSFSITYNVLGNLGVEGYVWNNLTPISGTQVFTKNTDNIAIGFRSTNAAEQTGAGVIEGDIFQDSNRNGSRDSGESGIYFYKLYLVDSSGGIRNTVEGAQATDQGGHFKYTNLPYGTYKIQLSNPSGEYTMDRPETSITLSSSNSSVTNIQISVFKQ
jgi:hypothetical protein